MLSTISSDLLTRRQAAEYLGGIAVQTLAVWACTNRYNLPLIKIGRSVRYRRQDLDAFIERQMVRNGEAVA